MKKISAFFISLLSFAVSGGIICYADAADPGIIPGVEGGTVLFYAGVGVVAVIILAVIILVAVKKSKNKKK